MLEIRNLSKHYGAVTALDDASFDVTPGRLVGFLGANGAGKTTTMRAVFGLVRPETGEVRWNGKVVDEKARMRFGYMPEQRGLYPRMRVHEELAYLAELHGMRATDAKRSASAWLERFGLTDRARSRVEELSHGNQQRVQLAAALVHDPELLVLDEPFSGLDPLGIEAMTAVLHERAAAGGAVLFSSHQLELVEDICEDVVIIDRGRIRASGPLTGLREGTGRRHVEIEFASPDGSFDPQTPGVRILARDATRLRLALDKDTDVAQILAAAERAGPVRAFTYQPPTLAEVFREAIGQ
jgi:ABC-2 type transport system ATP-binding protein